MTTHSGRVPFSLSLPALSPSLSPGEILMDFFMNSYEKFIQIPKWKSVNIPHLPMPPAFIILHNILPPPPTFFPTLIPTLLRQPPIYLKKTRRSVSFPATWPNCLIWPALSSIKSLSLVDRWRMDQRPSQWADQWQNSSISKWRWLGMERGNEGGEKKKTTNWRGCSEKKSAVPTHLAQILLLDLMLWLSLLPHFFSSLKLYESLLLSFHPLAFGTNTTEEERQRIMHDFQGLWLQKNRSVKHNSNRKQRKSRQEGDEREKRGRVMSRHPVDPQRSSFPHLHQRNQTSHGCTGGFFLLWLKTVPSTVMQHNFLLWKSK